VRSAGAPLGRQAGRARDHVFDLGVVSVSRRWLHRGGDQGHRLVGSVGCWDASWSVPTASAVTQARKRLGRRVFPELFERTCGPVAGDASPVAGMHALGTARGSFLRGWRLLAIDGFEVDVPDTKENAAEFGYAGSGENRSAFPKPGWSRWPSAAPTPSVPPRSTPTPWGTRPSRSGCIPGCAPMSC
jgi:hypothetical protein